MHCELVHTPALQVWLGWQQGSPRPPQAAQLPFWHTCDELQGAHAPPPAPHAESSPTLQAVPSQQPLPHEVASQTHMPI
ncbi:MAG TPA: hypothetical protein VKN99_25330, partial [Polyangia bacterium]|nr:hypothetical protein [Polyangia bacterium]